MKPEDSTAPSILERLVQHAGNQSRFSDMLGIPRAQICKWLKTRTISLEYALDIHDLKIRDQWGTITAMDILAEHRAVKAERIRRALEG